jgi:hypothetical protein
LQSYAHAYHEAANSLVQVFRGKAGYSDAEACPIVFLYRHAIELYLKAILLWGEGLVHLQTGDPLDVEVLFRTHEFRVLLPPVRRVFEIAGWLEAGKGLPKYGTYPEIEGVILEFEEIDPRSFAFRYPIDTKGEAHLPN